MNFVILANFLLLIVVLLVQRKERNHVAIIGKALSSISNDLTGLQEKINSFETNNDFLLDQVKVQVKSVESITAEIVLRQRQDMVLRQRQLPQGLRGLLEETAWHSSQDHTDPTSNYVNPVIALPESGQALLNIGCGTTYDDHWINLDLVSHSSDVIAFDILQTLPVPDSSIDVVYASHLLEHLAPHEVPRFMGELFRILKPSGILRVVVPDLEQIVSEYIRALKAAKHGNVHDRLKHQWMIVELLDQLVRQSADGGEMMRFLFRNGAEGVEIATTRLGSEISDSPVPWDAMKTKGEWVLEVADQDLFSDESLFERRSNTSLFDLAMYRKSGDAHLWMYDEVSLADVLTRYGFSDPIVQSAFTSKIPEFACYNLDVTAEGSQRKPDSLYMEAIKPELSNH